MVPGKSAGSSASVAKFSAVDSRIADLTTLGNARRQELLSIGQRPDADNRRREGARASEFTAVSISSG
jgi:hypothetical protein